MGHLLGEGRIQAQKTKFLPPKALSRSPGNNFTPRPRGHHLLCDIHGQCVSPIPSQGIDQKGGNLLPWALISPAAAHYPLMWKICIEKWNFSRRARHLPPSRRSKLQSLGVAPNRTWLLTVRSFPAKAPNVIAKRTRKQNSLRRTVWMVERSLLYRRVPGRVSSLAKDPGWSLWQPFIPEVYMTKSTSPNFSSLLWIMLERDTNRLQSWLIF